MDIDFKDFLVKFLPNYRKKCTSMFKRMDDVEMGTINDLRGLMAELIVIKENFHIALQNYTDKICEKQRESCCEAYDFCQSPPQNINSILNAEQPKIEEI
jgi:hypothetical protein